MSRLSKLRSRRGDEAALLVFVFEWGDSSSEYAVFDSRARFAFWSAAVPAAICNA
jgi:hypothetical protein